MDQHERLRILRRTLGHRLQAAGFRRPTDKPRKMATLSHEEAAKLLGVTRNVWQGWESRAMTIRGAVLELVTALETATEDQMAFLAHALGWVRCQDGGESYWRARALAEAPQ